MRGGVGRYREVLLLLLAHDELDVLQRLRHRVLAVLVRVRVRDRDRVRVRVRVRVSLR